MEKEKMELRVNMIIDITKWRRWCLENGITTSYNIGDMPNEFIRLSDEDIKFYLSMPPGQWKIMGHDYKDFIPYIKYLNRDRLIDEIINEQDQV